MFLRFKEVFVPPVGWYFQRLRAMSPLEIPWRAWRMGQARIGAYRCWPAAAEMNIGSIWDGSCTANSLRQRNTSGPYNPSQADMARWPASWRERCLSEAEDLLAHRFSFFMFAHSPFGDAIDWQCDYASGKRAPLEYAGRLDYRDPARVGDVKVIWELSRMQHLTRLAQAWRWSGDERFPREIVSQITDWIEHNPWMMGIHWTSPMECALRLISWTWAFHLIRDWPELTDEFCRVLIGSIYQHLSFIHSTYSRFSSANNHLIAEASGAYLAAAYWQGLRQASVWKAQAYRHLARECLRQNLPDGVNEERTFPYQFFVWDLLLLPVLMGRSLGEDFPQEYWDRLEKMAEFMAWISDGAGHTPNVGDQDDGLAINLGGDHASPITSMLAVAGNVFKRDDFLQWSGVKAEEKAAWLLGAASARLAAVTPARTSRSFPDGGYHVLRSGMDKSIEVLVLVDVAPIGDPVTGAHGHADALSIILHLGGQPFLSDPGTYSYQNTPQRHAFRATAQHSTLCFGTDDQGEYLNRFMWGKRPEVELLTAAMDGGGGTVAGRVKWWTGSFHERRIDCDFVRSRLWLHDAWRGGGSAFLNFTVAPGIEVIPLGTRGYRLSGRRAILTVECGHGALVLQQMDFSSRCYQKEPATRIRVSLPGAEGGTLTTLSWQWRD